MGTRNITRVISNGDLKVCQYCQWDGYPTGAGQDIIDFIRTTDDDKMAARLSCVNLAKVTNDGARTFYTGAPYSGLLESICADEMEFRNQADKELRNHHGPNLPDNWYELMKARTNELLVGKYGQKAIDQWRLAIRDTGCGVLPIIYGSEDFLTLWTEDYLLDNFGDWQIAAVWELDYDKKVLTGWWHGHKHSWIFEELRDMSDEQVDEVMREFENIDCEEEN